MSNNIIIPTPEQITDKIKKEEYVDYKPQAMVVINSILIPALNKITNKVYLATSVQISNQTKQGVLTEIKRIMLDAGWEVKNKPYTDKTEDMLTLEIQPYRPVSEPNYHD